MSTIIEYIEKYGKKTFEEMSYNDVDGLIFSILSYIDFDGILENKLEYKIPLSKAADAFFEKYTKKEIEQSFLGMPDAIKTFKTMKNKKRYKDLSLYNYVYNWDENKQFSAVFIDIDDKLTFVSYEGTDDLVSGWKEDAALSYCFPVPAHKEAIKYINRSISLFSKRKYIVGGHSKGGNLALVASMYANPLVKNKIVKVYNFDGPGLKTKQIESRQYKKVLPKYKMIIPNYSVIGLLLRHRDDYQVVLSNKKGILAHNFISWQIMDDHFVPAKLSAYSKKVDRVITNWLNTYNDEQRKHFVEEVFQIFSRCKIDSLLDIKITNLPILFHLVKESKKIDNESKKMIVSLFNFIVSYFIEDASGIIKKELKNKTLHKKT